MEYMEGGELQWQSDGEPYLTMDQTRRCMRDVVLGLQYCMCFVLFLHCGRPFLSPTFFLLALS